MNDFQQGDIIHPKQKGASRLMVLDPPRTTHGKLRMVRLDSPAKSYQTAWWRFIESLPSGFYLEPRGRASLS